ncbi:AAA family ATPase, partial [Kitasatospora sp. NPDC088548]|uniref:AAA family ATPase n=1 Tax=Kitasatospora sp. NPDC088548 TaxID=3364075 RepID=UPI0038065EF4
MHRTVTSATRTLASLMQAKIGRRAWNPALHPRDSRGRFVETGGIARLWGGGLARVLRALTNDRVQVQRLDNGRRAVLPANRLTMVARPDGTAPTRSKEKVELEDERRHVDPKRGDGLEQHDNGDPSTPDKPHAADDDGEEIREPNTPDWHPAEEKPDRRFESVSEVRDHWDGDPDQFTATESEDDRLAEARRNLPQLTRTAQLSEHGNFVVAGSGKKWAVYHAASGQAVQRGGSKKEALAKANELEELAGDDGRRFNWNAPHAADRFKSDDGQAAAIATHRRLHASGDRDGSAAADKRESAGGEQAGRQDGQRAEVASPAQPITSSEGDDESVRADRGGVLQDVPADGDGGAGRGGGGALRGARQGGGGADRGDLGGPGRRDGAGRGSAGADRADQHGEASRQGDGDAGADLRPAEGGRDGGSGHAAGVPDPDHARVAFGTSEQEEKAPTWRPPADGQNLVPVTVVARAKANIAALRMLRRLQEEQRPATADEQAVLARWSGWGATPQLFVDSPAPEFAPLARELRSLLSGQEWESAADNTLNAHYTDPQITQAIWGALEDLGFDGGEVLEPGAGSGNFIGYAPPGAHMTGVELDPITAGIAKALYPHADIRAEGFEKTRVPDGSFDATVGNVPFGAYEVVDLRHNKGNHRIHNHFILKSLDLTRPGGIVAVVTSRYTMDGSTVRAEDARMEMARKADLLGAIRLPSGAHRRAAGTDVVTDLLIFRRRDGEKEFSSGRDRKKAIKPLAERSPSDPPMWVHSAPAEGLPGQDPKAPVDPSTRVFVNPYFTDNPDRVLGQMAVGHGLNRANDLRVDGDGHLAPALNRALKDVADRAKADGLAYRKDGGERRKPQLLDADSDRVDGHVQIEPDGTFTQVRDGQVHQFDVPKTQADEARALLGLRDVFKQLVAAENAPENDEALIERLRADLKARYDEYHRQHGAINRFKWKVRKGTDPETGEPIEKAIRERPQRGGLFTKDPTMAIVKALDSYDAETDTTTPASIFTKRAGRHRALAETADSPQDAAALVQERTGWLDLDELATVMKTSPEEAKQRLLAARSVDPVTQEETPLVFELPEDGALEMASDYLSGNVRAKLNDATALAGTDPRFRINVEQLERVLPPDIPAGEVDAPLGASWLGAGPVQAFLNSILDEPVKVEYQGGSLWKVEASTRVKKSTAATQTWGTADYHTPALVEAILRNQKIQVRRYNKDGSSYVDVDATDLAKTKAEELGERFQEWLWEDPKRAEAIKKAYNDTHNNLALRSYDGQRRTMPGLAEHFKPHDHQHAAVARMVNEPAVLLAHEVGAGKTAEMAMGVMELRRLGLVNKPVIVVPGHMLQQFHDEFLELYPDAKLLAAGSDDLAGRKRREFIARVAATDTDAVILTQRAFESIDMRPEVQLAYINREKESLQRALARAKGEANAAKADAPASGRETRMVKEIRARLKALEAKITKKTSALKDKAGLSFEDTGIDYVVVDEAHHYKNLSTNSSIPGAAIEGSNRASDLDMKLDYLRGKTSSGRVVTFATATPISNSVTEAHTMLRYLRPDLLERARIRDFDEFASTYGKIINGVELAADGSGFKEVSRFAAFRNMPELLRIWKTVADVKTAEDLNLDVPDLSTGRAITIKVQPTEGQLDYQDSLARRAAAVKSGMVEPSEDNMLKISSDGRKVSLDPRMVGIDEQGHKLVAAADNIHRIYESTKDTEYPTSKDDPTPHQTKGGLQIVFLDMGTPKDPSKKKGKGKKGPANLEELEGDSPFPAYAELKALLAERGIPEDKVRFVHEAKNDAEKARLFHDARTGKIAVLIGSTTKMGVGTNVQLRATALHHLDCPWRPADLEQRNGRIIRQGNANPEVSIFQYVTEQSFDGFSWQTVARKAKFIRQLMKGNLTDRTVEDIPDGVFNAEQVTALATGNPYLLEQANVRASLAMLTRQHKAHMRAIDGARATIRQTEELRDYTSALVSKLRAVNSRKRPTRGDAFNATFGGKELTNRKDAAEELARLARDVIDAGSTAPWGAHPEVRLGEVGGIAVVAKFRVRYNDGARQFIADISMPDVPGSKRSYTKAMLDGQSSLPVTRLEDALADTEANIEAAESFLRREERNAAIAVERLDKPFEKASELEAVRERSRLVNAIISAQSKEPSSDADERAARAQRIEMLEHALREARIRAGESPEEVDDPAEVHDLDVMPRTPAPPVVSTDAAGRTTVTWPDREARKARRKKDEQERARQAAEKRDRGRTPEEQVDLAPEDVQADLESIGADDDEPAGDQVAMDPEQVTADLESIAPEAEAEPVREDENTAAADGAALADPVGQEPEVVPAGNNELAEARQTAPSRETPATSPKPTRPAPADRPEAARLDRGETPEQVTLDPAQVDADLADLTQEQDRPDGTVADVQQGDEPYEPSDWAKRVTISREPDTVVVTDTGFGPHLAAGEELRAWMKDENNGVGRFHYRPDDKEWRYNRYGRQADADPAAAEAALRQKIEEIDRQRSDGPAAAATPAAAKGMTPTPQQAAILEAGTAGETIAVTARAGTGKTSTLKMLARSLPADKKIMYLAFGRKVAADARQAIARGEFPSNVQARTANSLAATNIAPELANKLGKTPLQSNEVRARILGITDDLPDGPDKVLTPEQQAGLVMSTINRWVLTSDPEITIDSFPGRNRELFDTLKPYIDKAWADISDPDGRLRYDYDYSVKHWALSDPKIEADVIFWDEAQDINPVLEGVVRRQDAQVVLVGDPGQSIFEFRGTSNALNSYPVDRHLSLNQSWRFGPKVADLGNRFLALAGEVPDLEGNPKKVSEERHLDKPDAVLVRTNVGAVEEISEAVKAGRKPAVLGGTKELKAFLNAAERLQKGRAADHPDLAGFSSWKELEKYVEDHEEEAGSLRALVRLVNGDDDAHDLDGTPRLNLRDLLTHVVDENKPHDVIIGTVHKAKGAEWPTVRIGNDFPQPRRNKHGAIISFPSDEDMRLNYVAVTRAEEAIDLGSLDWVYEATNDGRGKTLDLHAMAARHRGEDRRAPEMEAAVVPPQKDAKERESSARDATPEAVQQAEDSGTEVSIAPDQVAADLESITPNDEPATANDVEPDPDP